MFHHFGILNPSRQPAAGDPSLLTQKPFFGGPDLPLSRGERETALLQASADPAFALSHADTDEGDETRQLRFVSLFMPPYF